MSVGVGRVPGAGAGVELGVAARGAARTLATVSFVGLLAGWFVVGVLARLAMFLLAELNPAAAGTTSDDGFTMGQLTLTGSANLMFLVGTLFGVLGAGAYVALRGLMVGPPWFRLLSVALGPAVVAGAGLVHTDGVDFTLLEPLWLAVAMFVAIPGVYVALLSVCSERLLARDRPLPLPLLVLGGLGWVAAFPLLPVLLVLAGGFALLHAVRRTARGRRVLGSPVGSWLLRGALTVVFVVSLAELVRDVRILS